MLFEEMNCILSIFIDSLPVKPTSNSHKVTSFQLNFFSAFRIDNLVSIFFHLLCVLKPFIFADAILLLLSTSFIVHSSGQFSSGVFKSNDILCSLLRAIPLSQRFNINPNFSDGFTDILTLKSPVVFSKWSL